MIGYQAGLLTLTVSAMLLLPCTDVAEWADDAPGLGDANEDAGGHRVLAGGAGVVCVNVAIEHLPVAQHEAGVGQVGSGLLDNLGYPS